MSLEENSDLAEFMRSNPGRNSPASIAVLWDLNEAGIPVPVPDVGESPNPGTPEVEAEPEAAPPDPVVVPATPPDDDSVSIGYSEFVPDSGIASSAEFSGFPGSGSSSLSEDNSVKIYKLMSTPLGSGNRSGASGFLFNVGREVRKTAGSSLAFVVNLIKLFRGGGNYKNSVF